MGRTKSGARKMASKGRIHTGDITNASSEIIRDVFERVSDAFVALDRNWRYTYVNKKAADIFGRTSASLIGKHIWTEFPEGIGQPFYKAYYRALRTQKPILLEEYYPPYDRWFENRIYPSKEGLTIYFSDVTDRKKKELDLAETNERFINVFESSPHAKMVVSRDLKIRYANQQAKLLVNKPNLDLVGYNINNVFHKGEFGKYLGLIKKVFTHEEIQTLTLTLQIKRGAKQFEVKVIPIRDKAGETYEALSIFYDVTAYVEKQTELQLLISKLSEAEKIAQFGSWEFNMDTNEGWWSEGQFDLFGFERAVTPPSFEQYLERIHPDDRGILLETWGNVTKGVPPHIKDFRTNPKYGPLRWLRPSYNLIVDKSSRNRVLQGVLHDVTAEKVAEQETQFHIKRLSSLRKIDEAVTQLFDFQKVMDTVLQQSIEQIGADAAAILLADVSHKVLEYAGGTGFANRAITKARVPTGTGLAGRAFKQNKILYIRDLAKSRSMMYRTFLLEKEHFTTYYGVPISAKERRHGVLELFFRNQHESDQKWEDFLVTISGQVAMTIENTQLFQGIQQANKDLAQAYEATLAGWSNALDLRDHETQGHTERVTEIAVKLAKYLGVKGAELDHIRRGALLHDIGKMGVPDAILHKAGPLSEEEWKQMRMHPTYAYSLLSSIPYLKPALDIPYCHHEKWDGSGYPRGLKGEEIPLAARIFSIADVYDALTSNRPYRGAWSEDKALEFIGAQAGNHFEPKAVEAFRQLHKKGIRQTKMK